MRRFTGQSVVVFGGSSGIGAAAADRLALEGARVLVLDLPGRIGTDLECDARDPKAVANALETAGKRLGGLDVVVNAIGRPADGSAADTDDEVWESGLDVNLGTAFRIGRSAISMMAPAGRGAIVHVASDAGLVAWPGQVTYTAAKGGLVHLVKAQAVDAAPLGIRVNCVCPSFCRTAMLEGWLEGQPKGTLEVVSGMQPLGRLAEPEEVAAAIAFLASHEADSVTGVALPVDGGICAQ
jgi:meso-butanediol dehydrogenase/(S,S)-butanediol dehydrogenase/diacetyl reductase